ncbi:MAG TPA: hypothetical protein V6D13_03745 [Halomicronema sp.]
MSATRFFHKSSPKRQSYLAIVALPDEASAFSAYRLLQYHGISPEHLAIVGEGYSSPERVGLFQPMQIAFANARRFAFFTGTVGTTVAVVGVLICILILKVPVHLSFLLLLIPVGALVAGFLGAVIGGILGLLGEGSTAGIYLHHLRQGHYLLMLEGPEKLVRQGQDILKQYCLPKAR